MALNCDSGWIPVATHRRRHCRTKIALWVVLTWSCAQLIRVSWFVVSVKMLRFKVYNFLLVFYNNLMCTRGGISRRQRISFNKSSRRLWLVLVATMSSFRWLLFNKHYKIATPGLCGSVQYHPWRAAIIIYDAIFPVTERDWLSSCRRTTKTHFGQSFQLITWGVANFHPKATGTLSSLPSSSFIVLLVGGTNNLQRVRMHPGICLYCWMLALVEYQ